MQRKIQRIYFSDTTDSNGNVYCTGLNTTQHIILQTTASGDHAATAMLNGDGSGWNFHISDYTNWNVGEGVAVTVFVEYYEK